MSHDLHVPVLLAETIEALDPRPGGRFIDCTLGGGGHAAAVLERTAPDGLLLGLDTDAEMLDVARRRLAPFGARARLIHANFGRLAEVADANGFVGADGVLFDFGVASPHLDQVERGFSFQGDAPLDMRLDRGSGPTAADLLRDLDERELADVIYRYGEEPHARAIAHAVAVERRQTPVASTGQLARLIGRVVRGGRIHPATRTFQALRIAINRELEVIPIALRSAHTVVRDGGRLAAISFHSLEDRLVKTYFAEGARACICPPTLPICRCGGQARLELVLRKPVTAGAAEVRMNPRSRSAHLRCARRIGPPRS